MEVDDLFIISFSKSKKRYAQVIKKIDALKENQCTTHWLLNGFFSREMFNLLFG